MNISLTLLQIALTTIDWNQTRQISVAPNQYVERNVLLGKHPSADVVNRYFVLSESAILGSSYVLPEYENEVLSTSIAVESFVIVHNRNIGLSIRLKY